MAVETSKTAIAKFPLRLMPSVRRTAEAFSEKEGVSLNQFINVAVAEKLAHLQHEEWMHNRKQPTRELAERALALLAKAGSVPPEPGDELPEGYLTVLESLGAAPLPRQSSLSIPRAPQSTHNKRKERGAPDIVDKR